MGEINIIQTALMIIVGFVSDDVRQLVGNKSEQGALFAYLGTSPSYCFYSRRELLYNKNSVLSLQYKM